MENAVKRIGVLTSGGDAPGMNAAIRSVVRSALSRGIEVVGIRRGWQGLINGDFVQMDSSSVSRIINRGGTILYTARSDEFRTEEGQQKAANTCKLLGLDGIVAIGGDGTFRGAQDLSKWGISVVGIPGTIDNDIVCTDYTIGYDTALNTIMWCVDRIRDTATSHERLFFIEVMGRNAGFLALNGAIASGAEAAIIPEISTEVDQLAELIQNGFRKSKNSSIVLVAESPVTGGAMGLAERVRKEFPEFDVRVSILGHLQRGGRPSARDRILASRTGSGAIEAIMQGQRNVMIGVRNNEVVYVPLSEAIRSDKPFDRKLIKVLDELSI